ncbi:MAG: MarR family transcriptional regulator [Alphaproteobacteria bacterium]|nr:MarR family transcriptional regulator [Alphaproteobacteria bacterium]
MMDSMDDDSQSDTRKLGLWMRLVANSNLIEKEIRALFRSEFGVTLPRFDLMAALYRQPGGLTMGELSRRLLVSNGNITGIVERLQKEGLVKRWVLPTDRRIYSVGLTLKGRTDFREMADRHKDWIGTILAELGDEDLDSMIQMMDHLRKLLRARQDREQED